MKVGWAIAGVVAGADRRGAGARRHTPWGSAERVQRALFSAQEELIIGTDAGAVRDVRRARAAYRGVLRASLRDEAPEADRALRRALGRRRARRAPRRRPRAGRRPRRGPRRGVRRRLRGDARRRRPRRRRRHALVAAAARLPHRHALHAPGRRRHRRRRPPRARQAGARRRAAGDRQGPARRLPGAPARAAQGRRRRAREGLRHRRGRGRRPGRRLLGDPRPALPAGPRRGRRGRPPTRAFAELRAAAESGDRQAAATARAEIDQALDGFTAAPFTAAESARRAQQLLRFVALVPVEYGRGVKDGRVTHDFEIQEAIAFGTAADAAFDDLRDQLAKRDPARTAAVGVEIDRLAAVADRRRRARRPASRPTTRSRSSARRSRTSSATSCRPSGRSRPTTPTTT